MLFSSFQVVIKERVIDTNHFKNWSEAPGDYVRLGYAQTVWDVHQQNYIDKVEKIQQASARYILTITNACHWIDQVEGNQFKW